MHPSEMVKQILTSEGFCHKESVETIEERYPGLLSEYVVVTGEIAERYAELFGVDADYWKHIYIAHLSRNKPSSEATHFCTDTLSYLSKEPHPEYIFYGIWNEEQECFVSYMDDHDNIVELY